MDSQHFLILLAAGGLVTVLACACLSLFKFSQNRENAEDEILWEYLLRPE
jgi:hypothetical protein